MSAPVVIGIIAVSLTALGLLVKGAWIVGKALYDLLTSLATKEETAAIATTLARKVEEQGIEDSTERQNLIREQNETLAEILEQAKKTNGTVLRHDSEIKVLQKAVKRRPARRK